MRQRATEVQRELEEDLALLQRVHLAMERETCAQAERQQACQQLASTLRAMTEQTQWEAALAKLNTNIFQEEAMLELRLQEERWQKDNEARRDLLASVIAEQQGQMRAAREKVAKQRQRLQEECEELNRVTRHHMRLQRAQAEHRVEQHNNYKMQLDQQVIENKSRRQQEREQQRREEEAKSKRAAEQAVKLDSELRKIILGQQKVAWL
ncbi:hypothetical protein B566_EDAN011789 [Ephemera danica]|nr:hypothetical protein B566_EDAN011789 [Ephemera danica]